MTDLGSPRPSVDTSRAGRGGPTTAWSGWAAFAGVLLFMLGGFHVIAGIVGLVKDDYFLVSSSGLVIDVDYTVWGWTHLLLGLLILVSGLGVLSGNAAARAVAVVLAGLSALANLAFIEAYPIWSVVVITVDVLVIYALTVHGGELRDSRR